MSNVHRFSRSELLLGREGLARLASATVAVFGVGGVGSFVVEGLARAGVGHLVLVDNDKISLTNINRQLHSLTSTVGKSKTAVMRERIMDINPAAKVNEINDFYLPDNADSFFIGDYDYVVDAVDTVTAKLSIICRCKELGVPVKSSMGTGNKLNTAAFEIADIYDTTMCPLAKVMRKELKKRDIDSLKVVYSKEKPVEQASDVTEVEEPSDGRRSIPGSTAFCPPVAGLILASEVIKDLTGTFSRE